MTARSPAKGTPSNGVVRVRPVRAPVVTMVMTGTPATSVASVTWPLLSRKRNLSSCGPDLANNQAPGRDAETCHIARCPAFGSGTWYPSAWMSPIWASVEASADARPARCGQSTSLIIRLTRQATSSCARRGELAPVLSTGRNCQICTAAVQVNIERCPRLGGSVRIAMPRLLVPMAASTPPRIGRPSL